MRAHFRLERDVRARLGALLTAGARRWARKMVVEIQQSISMPYPPASAPGMPPHRRTGRLLRSMQSSVSRVGRVVRVQYGATARSPKRKAPYPAYLQRGTRRMAPRPYLDLTGRRIRQLLVELAR